MNEKNPPVYRANSPSIGVALSPLNQRRAQLMAMPNDTPWSIEEVAIVMQCSARSVERAIASGGLKSARVAGGRRIKKEWVLEYLHRQWDGEAK